MKTNFFPETPLLPRRGSEIRQLQGTLPLANTCDALLLRHRGPLRASLRLLSKTLTSHFLTIGKRDNLVAIVRDGSSFQ